MGAVRGPSVNSIIAIARPSASPRLRALLYQGGMTIATTDYITDDDLELVLRLLTPRNRLVCLMAIATGLRIGDVVSMPADIRQRTTIHEAKTGKSRRVWIPTALYQDCIAQARPPWLFPGARHSKTGHITRQAVWADIKRAARAMRSERCIAPHSLRKVYAVRMYQASHDLSAVSRALNHDDMAVTAIYALADQMAQRRPTRQKRRKKR